MQILKNQILFFAKKKGDWEALANWILEDSGTEN